MRLKSVSLRGSGTAVYTDPFPLPDIVGVQLNFEEIDATGTATAILQHSATAAENEWLDKTTVLNGVTITVNQANVKFGSDSGSTPSLSQGRFKITPTTTAKGRVDVFVSGRSY